MRPANVVYMKFGSHLYGLANENSDVDYKGIFLPSLNELLLNTYKPTIDFSTGDKYKKNSSTDVDIGLYSLSQFIKHATTGESVAIDMLHCARPEFSTPVWEELVAQRTKFYSKNLKAFVGYVKQQAAKYGVKGSRLADISQAIASLSTLDQNLTLGEVKDQVYFGEYAEWKVKPNPSVGHDNEFYMVNAKMYQSTNTVLYAVERLQQMYDGYGHRAKKAEKNEGVDWKAMSHALRAGYQARDIYKYGDFVYPLAETDFLKQVKQGKLDFAQVASELERLVAEIEKLSENSNLPEKADTEYWDKWLLSVYAREFGISV